ncbi:hypothetical protein GOBAR_DD01197 [Gossypium barbadense]|nr:hypothetical protein GOBAR_DD01197 [Gossypium barbadense]
MGKSNKKGTSKQFRWTKPMEHVFLEILAEEAQKGNKPSNTFRAVSINLVVEAISKRFQVQCDAKYVENHLRIVKNQRQIICKIRGESSFGWDDNMKMITCDRATYDAAVMDLVPVDYDNEEAEEVRTNVSSSGTSKREQLGKIANALEQFTADNTPQLY